MDEWLTDLLIDDNKREGLSANSYVEEEAELVGVASDELLLSQEDIYQLDEGFQDSDTEILWITIISLFFIFHFSLDCSTISNNIINNSESM